MRKSWRKTLASVGTQRPDKRTVNNAVELKNEPTTNLESDCNVICTEFNDALRIVEACTMMTSFYSMSKVALKLHRNSFGTY